MTNMLKEQADPIIKEYLKDNGFEIKTYSNYFVIGNHEDCIRIYVMSYGKALCYRPRWNEFKKFNSYVELLSYIMDETICL